MAESTTNLIMSFCLQNIQELNCVFISVLSMETSIVSIVVYMSCKFCVSVHDLHLHESNVNICRIHLYNVV
jgi:hypothetical protein